MWVGSGSFESDWSILRIFLLVFEGVELLGQSEKFQRQLAVSL